MPIGFALTGAQADERQVLLDLLHDDPTLAASRPGQALIADRNQFGRQFEASIAERGIESTSTPSKDNSTWNNTEAAPPTGVLVRVLQRLLAMTTAIWHNDHTGQPVRRSLLAYDQ